MLTPRTEAEFVDPWLVIGEYDCTNTKVKLYHGLITTFNNARIALRYAYQDVLKRYVAITLDNRSAVNMSHALAVVLGDVQLAWYEQRGIPVPAKVTALQEERMAKAKQAAPEAEGGGTATAEKEPRVTNRSIIENGLLAGKDDDVIIAEVKEHFPNGKADKKHVAYYRHFLIKEGKLEKPAKAEKPAAAPKQEAPPAAQTAVASKPAAKAGRKR